MIKERYLQSPQFSSDQVSEQKDIFISGSRDIPLCGYRKHDGQLYGQLFQTGPGGARIKRGRAVALLGRYDSVEISGGNTKIDHKKMFIVLTLLVFLATITAMLVPDHTVKIIMFALCGFGCGPLWPLIVDTVAKKNKGASGPALNVMLAFSGLGGAAFPFLSGALVNSVGQSAAFYACAAASVFMLAVYLASAKMKSV